MGIPTDLDALADTIAAIEEQAIHRDYQLTERLVALEARLATLEADGARRQREIDQLRSDLQRLRWNQRTGRQT